MYIMCILCILKKLSTQSNNMTKPVMRTLQLNTDTVCTVNIKQLLYVYAVHVVISDSDKTSKDIKKVMLYPPLTLALLVFNYIEVNEATMSSPPSLSFFSSPALSSSF